MSFKNGLNFGGRTVENNLHVLNTAVAEERFRSHLFGLERHGFNPGVGPESDGSSSYTMIRVNFG